MKRNSVALKKTAACWVSKWPGTNSMVEGFLREIQTTMEAFPCRDISRTNEARHPMRKTPGRLAAFLLHSSVPVFRAFADGIRRILSQATLSPQRVSGSAAPKPRTAMRASDLNCPEPKEPPRLDAVLETIYAAYSSGWLRKFRVPCVCPDYQPNCSSTSMLPRVCAANIRSVY